MGVHHLFSIDEDQLRNWQGNPDELLRNIGSAVVLACLDRALTGVTVREGTSQASGSGDSITVAHVSQHEGDEFDLWAWASGDAVCIADLPDEDLDLMIALAHTVRAKTVDEAGNLLPTVVPD